MIKKSKRKGRPPKFVVDENGKEVYGLSYNTASCMFYAAFSNPRVYFGGGKKRHEVKKTRAILRYKEYQKHQHLSPEQQTEAIYIDEIHKKARELIANDRFIQAEINEKARVLLNLGELSQIVEQKVLKELESKLHRGELDNYLQKYLETYPGSKFVKDKAAEVLPGLMTDERVRDVLSEQFEEMIKCRPIKAAKQFGVKQLVYFDDREFQAKLRWKLVWRIFWEFHIPEKLPFPKEQFIAVQENMNDHLEYADIEKISKSDFKDALTYNRRVIFSTELLNFKRGIKRVYQIAAKKREIQEMMATYLAIPLANRLMILKHVFQTVRLEGFPQCNYVLDMVVYMQRQLQM